MMPSPASAGMDRLSDRLGALIPGCSRLPSRHPIKVSLVMGLLGIAGGWITTGALLVVRNMISPQIMAEVFGPISGTILFIFVLLPLILWHGLPIRRMIFGWVLAILAGWFHVACINSQSPNASDYAAAGIWTGLAFAWVGAASSQRNHLWMIIPIPLVSGIMHAALVVSMDPVNRPNWLPSWIVDAVDDVLIANLYGILFSSVGITFGYSLWDRTPPPKFAPEQTNPAEEAPL